MIVQRLFFQPKIWRQLTRNCFDWLQGVLQGVWHFEFTPSYLPADFVLIYMIVQRLFFATENPQVNNSELMRMVAACVANVRDI